MYDLNNEWQDKLNEYVNEYTKYINSDGDENIKNKVIALNEELEKLADNKWNEIIQNKSPVSSNLEAAIQSIKSNIENIEPNEFGPSESSLNKNLDSKIKIDKNMENIKNKNLKQENLITNLKYFTIFLFVIFFLLLGTLYSQYDISNFKIKF